LPGCQVERLAIGEAPIRLGANHLYGLNPFVLRPPDVHVGDRVRAAPSRRIRTRRLSVDAEEHALFVFTPGERRAVADDPSLREPRRRSRIELRRGQLAIAE